MTVNKILFITLSNIGDAVMSLPAFDFLRQGFPEAKITVVTSPRAAVVFQSNPAVDRLIIYDKRCGLEENIRLFLEFWREGFTMVIDLRNTFFGAFLPARYKIPLFPGVPAGVRHMKDRHLYKVLRVIRSTGRQEGEVSYKSLHFRSGDSEYIEGLLKEGGINQHDKVIVVAPGARSQIKRWGQDAFLQLVRRIYTELKPRIILAGDKDDAAACDYISAHARFPVLNLSGRTTFQQLACLFKKAECLVTNDSALLHAASYLNIPAVAIFGPTSDCRYGPWSESSAVARKDIFCRPCQQAQCRFGTVDCMRFIKVEDVFRQVKNILEAGRGSFSQGLPGADYKRILIARTDRIGDVLLSTPAIKAVREAYPHAYIAVMVSPYAREIVEGNPYLDEVISYDKDFRHKGWLASAALALSLRRKKFDLALILHPNNRVHILTFFSGIRRRVGYDRKFGFLLNDRIGHTKQEGQRHESDYVLDLVRHLGISPQGGELFMPLREESEKWAEELFLREGFGRRDKILAVHPGASCPSKVWFSERFAAVAERLARDYALKVVVVAGPKDLAIAEDMASHMRTTPVTNLAGKTSLSQLASLLKRCSLFISNDSGPVHVAVAVGTPVISIFGRAQEGLSPRRWGPLTSKARVLHKDAGCSICLAHECRKNFLCLQQINVEEVVKAAEELLEV